MEKSNSQYDSFLFWRQPIPVLNLSELQDLGLIYKSGEEESSNLRSQKKVRLRLKMLGRQKAFNTPLRDLFTHQ